MKASTLLRMTAQRMEKSWYGTYACNALRSFLFTHPTAKAAVPRAEAYLRLFKPRYSEVAAYRDMWRSSFYEIGSHRDYAACMRVNGYFGSCMKPEAQEHRILAVYMAAEIARSEGD